MRLLIGLCEIRLPIGSGLTKLLIGLCKRRLPIGGYKIRLPVGQCKTRLSINLFKTRLPIGSYKRRPPMDACKMRLPIGSYRLDAFLHCSRCGLGTGEETLRAEDKYREENGGTTNWLQHLRLSQQPMNQHTGVSHTSNSIAFSGCVLLFVSKYCASVRACVSVCVSACVG